MVANIYTFILSIYHSSSNILNWKWKFILFNIYPLSHSFGEFTHNLQITFIFFYNFCSKILTCNIDSDEIRDDLSLVGDCYALAGELIQYVHHLAPLQLQPHFLVPAFGFLIQPVLLLGWVRLLFVADEV